MEFVMWGVIALIGAFVTSKYRKSLEEKRLAKEREEFMKRILLARIQIHKEKHGAFPTAKEIVTIYSDVKDM